MQSGRVLGFEYSVLVELYEVLVEMLEARTHTDSVVGIWCNIQGDCSRESERYTRGHKPVNIHEVISRVCLWAGFAPGSEAPAMFRHRIFDLASSHGHPRRVGAADSNSSDHVRYYVGRFMLFALLANSQI